MTSLLRDWHLLARELMPAVAGGGPLEAWTVGTTEDAVALVAAHRAATRRDDLTVYLSPERRGRPVRFHLSDIRCVPTPERGSWLERNPSGWVPADDVMKAVLLGQPPGPVDLIALRTAPAPPDEGGRRFPPVRSVREGGWVLLAERPPGWEPPADLEPAGSSGRLFRKTSPADGTFAPTASEINDLAARLRRDALVESHAGLARSLAHRFADRGDLADDLESVALLALVGAAERYRTDRGSSFATFAAASVLGELKRHFRDKTWMMRVPRSMQETYLAVRVAKEELEQEMGASPTIPKVAERVGVSEEAVIAAMEAGSNYWPLSLDAPRHDEPDGRGSFEPAVEADFQGAVDLRLLHEALPRIGHVERQILKRLFFDGCTQREVAAEMGVSQMQISRLTSRALVDLRRIMEGTSTGSRRARVGRTSACPPSPP